ncbi:MAG: hypothetical protein R6U39_08535, partial [Candidatus Aegiribacteria sp.]
NQASDVAEGFLFEYLVQQNNFTPQEDLDNEDHEDEEFTVLHLFRAVPLNSESEDRSQGTPNHISLFFEYGSAVDLDRHDPEALAQHCYAEMLKAHPELKLFRFEVIVEEAM